MMSDNDYRGHMDVLASAGRSLLLVAETVDVPELLRIVNEAETLGPILEPTAYQRGGGTNLTDQRRFLEAIQAFQRACQSVITPVGASRG